MYRKGQPDYRLQTRVRLRIGDACSRSFGNACTARDSWGAAYISKATVNHTGSSEGESSLPLNLTLPRHKGALLCRGPDLNVPNEAT